MFPKSFTKSLSGDEAQFTNIVDNFRGLLADGFTRLLEMDREGASTGITGATIFIETM